MQINQCRICRSSSLHRFLDLGTTALANSYRKPEEANLPEEQFPLRAVVCESCGLVQIDEEVPPETLFSHYLYVSGTSDLVHTHAKFLASHLIRTGPLNRGDLVLEAASNDGTVLKQFAAGGVKTLGIEPAKNIAEQAIAQGIDTVCRFFNAETATDVRRDYGPAKLILARHVLAHVADLHGFVAGLQTVLDTDGRAVVECPHLLPFHDKLEYDTIYHEHLCYFSVRVLQHLGAMHGLEIIDAQEVEIHGGSILVTFQRKGGPRSKAPSVDAIIQREEAAGLHKPEVWDKFAVRVQQSRELLRAQIGDLLAQGRTIAGYGAPAKGMTLLSYCGFSPTEIAWLADRSPWKQGLVTPGHHIPIDHPDRLAKEVPDVVLMLAWNFAPEILRQQEDYRKKGGKFLLPLPVPTLV